MNNQNKLIVFLTVILIVILIFVVFYICYPREEVLVKKQLQKNMHEAKALVLTCIDFRLIDDTVKQMNKLGYLNNYDEFILAGSSLGYNGFQNYTGWNNILNEHIQLSKDLHDIEQIILIDHLECGAYKHHYSSDELMRRGEYNIHVENLKRAKISLMKEFPELDVLLFIIDIEGKVLNHVN